jgi:hypothetical protein
LEVERAWGQAQLGRRFSAQPFARLGVVMESDGVQIGLAVHAQVGAFEQGAAQRAVGVLVYSSLSRAVRVGKVHLNAGGLRPRLVVRHLALVVVRHGNCWA